MLRFIDWVLQLPEELERRLEEELPEITGGKTMPYVTSWERMAKKDEKIETAKKMLEKGMDISLIAEITDLPEEEIARLRDEAGGPGS